MKETYQVSLMMCRKITKLHDGKPTRFFIIIGHEMNLEKSTTRDRQQLKEKIEEYKYQY
jgi:hypothetical protein